MTEDIRHTAAAGREPLSFLLENGMSLEDIQRLLQRGMGLEELAEAAGRLLERGELLAQDAPPDFFQGRQFLHHVMGDYLIERYHACKINGAVHIYDHGVYRPGEDALYGFMIELLPSISEARRREVFRYVKASRRTPERELSPPRLIPFRSRIYDLEAGAFLDYSPQYVFLNRFPWDYDPQAPEAPAVTETLDAVAGGDPEVRELLLEAFGNCFLRVNRYRGAVMLYGPAGANGKSTLLNMLRCLVGAENASCLSLQDTAEKFRLAEVYGKAVNIGDDISAAYLPDSSIFKRLVTGEPVMAEKKGRDPIAFRSYAKLFFAMNALPPVGDKSRAFFSRLLLVPLHGDFSDPARCDPGRKDRPWSEEEMAYLLRLSMEALGRLTARGDFLRPACVERAMREYETENDPVLGFLTEYPHPRGRNTQEVYRAYQDWCRSNGHRNLVTHSKFSREVCRRYGLEPKPRRDPRDPGRFLRCFEDAEPVTLCDACDTL